MIKRYMRWKLKDLPTGSDVARLVEQKVITPTEARKMLFTEEGAANFPEAGSGETIEYKI